MSSSSFSSSSSSVRNSPLSSLKLACVDTSTFTESIALVDFRVDHGPGFDDHSDGITLRYAQGQVKRVPGIPSHMEYDAEREILVIADTGNQRVGVLDTQVGGQNLIPMPVVEEGTQLLLVDDGPQIDTLVQEGTFRGPTGLAMYDGILYVSDTAKGRISAIDPDQSH